MTTSPLKNALKFLAFAAIFISPGASHGQGASEASPAASTGLIEKVQSYAVRKLRVPAGLQAELRKFRESPSYRKSRMAELDSAVASIDEALDQAGDAELSRMLREAGVDETSPITRYMLKKAVHSAASRIKVKPEAELQQMVRNAELFSEIMAGTETGIKTVDRTFVPQTTGVDLFWLLILLTFLL
jgi:hypothetical protein